MKTRKKVLIGAGNQELQVSGSPAQARGISDKGYSDANLSTAKGYTDSEIQKLDSSASPASGNNVLTGITITDGKITGSTSASAVLTSGNQTIAGNKTFSGDTTLSGLVTAGKTNFISSSNEFNFIPAGFNNVVYINYRSASGAAAAVSSYYFDNGDSNGGLADLYAKKGVFTSLQSGTAPSVDNDVIRKSDLDDATYVKVRHNYNYSGSNTTYVGKRSDHLQFYIYPAAFGLTSFSGIDYADAIVDFFLVGDAFRTWNGSTYKNYDFSITRTWIRCFFNTSMHVVNTGVNIQRNDGGHDVCRYSNAFIYETQIRVFGSSSYIQVDPEVGSQIFTETSQGGARSAVLNDQTANSNCSMTVYTLGYSKR